jgi:hypothetical protein
LNGITFWLDVDGTGIELKLDLFHNPEDQIPIYSTTVLVVSGSNHIPIPPQHGPPYQNYYVRLSSTWDEIQVYGRGEDIYSPGEAYQNGYPLGADLAFRTSYEYDLNATIADFGWMFSMGWLVFPVIVLLFIPGWLLLDYANYRKDFNPEEQFAMSLGLSAALIPVLMLWTTTFGLSWGINSVRFAAFIFLVIFLCRFLLSQKSADTFTLRHSPALGLSSTTVVFFIIFVIVLFIRFAMIRDLAAPAWVDSIHHTLITKGIIESGGYPENYLPHIPINASYYHPGYHSLLAAFHWLTDLSLKNSMLIFGQILNALVIASVYLMTKTLVKDTKAGLVAATITGFMTLMPAYYVSWGRYTQLTGLLLLSPGIRWITSSNENRKNPNYFVIGGILLAGFFMVHYRVLIFLGGFIFAYWVGNLYRPDKNTWKLMKGSIQDISILGFSGIIFSLPWLVSILKVYFLRLAGRWGGNPVPPEIHWQYLTPVFGVPIMILAGIGLLIGILQKRRFSIIILVWTLVLIGIANPRYFHLPFPTLFINQTSVEIMLFIPISLLGGYAVSQLIRLTSRRIPTSSKWVHSASIFILGVVISILGAQRMLPIINPSTVIFREADELAMEWIRMNIDEDETIVINPTGWGYGLYMGNDGGFWISPLTGRKTMPPNVLYGNDKDFRTMVNQFIEDLLPAGNDSNFLWELLLENNYRYIYLGGRGGVISPQSLVDSPFFDPIYHKQGTWVFEVRKHP